MDFKKAMGLTSEKNETTTESVDIDSLIKHGKATIIHLHVTQTSTLPNKAKRSSQKQGNYAEALARDSKGKINFERIDISNREDPIVAKYNLKSLPQFWFYNSEGKQVQKLIDRFTAEDIDAAVKASKNNWQKRLATRMNILYYPNDTGIHNNWRKRT